MPAPSIPVFNGQIKTPWRGGYTSADQLAEFSKECAKAMEDCVYKLMWKNDSLMPFQFIRPFSMSLVTSWKLYDGPGVGAAELVDLTPEIDKLNYKATHLATGASVQYVTYLGEPLDAPLDAGTYYMRIVSGGVTYYWEPILIVCDTFGVNVFPTDSFDNGLAFATPGGDWTVYQSGGYPNIATDVIVVAGNPTNPAWEVEGTQIINTGDDSLYTWTSGAWVQDATPATGAWYDFETGNFYRFTAGAWIGLVDPVVVETDSACWAGTFDVPISYPLDDMPCVGSRMRFTITVEGMTTGSLAAAISDGESITIDADGTFELVDTVLAGQYLELVPAGTFDGCVTGVLAYCLTDASDCFYRLDWSNCGNIGNTYLTGGLTHSMMFEQSVYPVRPSPEVTVESRQRADGSVVQTTRRRETTWELQVGLVPWYVADALAELSLYDNVQLRPVGGGADTLTNVEVVVDNEEDFAECWQTVTIRFQIDPAAVACCDEYVAPCKHSCVDAQGYDTADPLVDDQVYLLSTSSRYATATGGSLGSPTACDSGLADIYQSAAFLRTVYFDLNTGAWVDLAVVGDITVTTAGAGCTINIEAVIPEGYAAVLQYLDADDEWVTDETYNLGPTEWLSNDIQRETPADENASKTLRLMVYVDGIGEDGLPTTSRCIIGYSVEFTYECP